MIKGIRDQEVFSVAEQSDKDSTGASVLTRLLRRTRDTLSHRLLEVGQKTTGADAGVVSYNVVFTGRFTLDEAQAVANIAAFFKVGTDNCRRLLQAGRVLKSYTDKAPADKLSRLLTKAGADCRVELETPEDENEPTRAQKLGFALEAISIPDIRLPDYRRFGRGQWAALASIGVLILVVALWLVLRSPVIHGNTPEEYQASIEALAGDVDPSQAEAVRRAVAMLTEASREAQRQSATTDSNTAARLVYASIEGKTANELLALAEARLEKQRVAYRQGLAEADEKLAVINQQLAAIAPDNAVVLDKIAVTYAAFGWPAEARTPTLAFSIRNDSSENLMRVSLQGYLYEQNGTLLASSPITYTVANGIEPGAIANASLPAPSDSTWVLPALRGKNDLHFKLRVANAENRSGQFLGKDYRLLEADRQRQLDWKAKVQAQLDAMKL